MIVIKWYGVSGFYIYSSDQMKGLYSPEGTTACQTKHASHKCISFKNLANTRNMTIVTHKNNTIKKYKNTAIL